MSISRFRQTGSALCLACFPLLLLAATVIAPWHSADESESQSLAHAGDQAAAVNLADLLLFLGVLLAVPGLLAVMRLTRARAPLASLVGGTLAVSGAVAGMLQVVTDQYNVLLSPLAGTGGVADAVQSSSARVMTVVLVVFLVGTLVGTFLLGVALWRSHAAPAWTGLSFVLSSVAGFVSHSVDLKWLDVVGGALLALAAIEVAGRVLRAEEPAPTPARPDPAPATSAA